MDSAFLLASLSIDYVDTNVYTLCMNTTTIQKWGNSYAVRLPKVVMRNLNLRAGNSVEIREASQGTTLSIIPAHRHAASLNEMIAGITKKNHHGAVDWGGAVGKEVW